MTKGDGGPDEANAFTVRTLAGWKTGAWNRLSATIELIDLEYADYKAGGATSGEVDTRKFWLTLIFNY